MKRALMVSGFSLLVSLALLTFLPEKTQWIPCGIFTLIALVSFLLRKNPYVKYLAFLSLIISISCGSLMITDIINTNGLSSYNAEPVSLTGYAESIHNGGFTFKTEIDGKIRSVYVNTDELDSVYTGKIYKVEGEITTVSYLSLDNARYYKSKGCYLICSPERVYRTTQTTLPYYPKPLKLIWDIKETLINTADELFSDDISGLMKAVLIGDKRNMDSEIKEDFSVSGLSHYTALSGLHTSIIAAAVFTILKKIGKRFAAVCTAFTVLFYMALVGFSFSVTRAGIMAIITYIGIAFFLRSDSLNSLGVAVVIILMFNPYAAADISFQLSVVATAGVILISPYIDAYLQKIFKRIHPKLELRTIRGTFATTLGANIALIPYYLFLFDEISLISPFTNLVAAPLMPFPLIFGIPALIIKQIPFIGSLSVLFKILAEIPMRLITLIAKYFALIPLASVRTGQVFLYIWFIGTIIAVLYLLVFNHKKLILRVILLSFASLFTMILCYNVNNQKNISVSFADSHGGIATVITTNDSCTVVSTAADEYSLYNIGQTVAVSMRDEIDLMVVSDNENADNLIKFLEENKVKTLFCNCTEVPEYKLKRISKRVDTFYDLEKADVAIGNRATLNIRCDEAGNQLFFMKLDDVELALTSGEFDLLSAYREIYDCDIFIIDSDCPQGIECFQPTQIFLTDTDNSREIYKKIYLLCDEITLAGNQTTIRIREDKYKCTLIETEG